MRVQMIARLCAAVVAMVLWQAPVMAQNAAPYVPALGNVTKACLPEAETRMMKDRDQPCHCPPRSMCPETEEEWNAGEKLPPYIQEYCCKRPYQCTLEVLYNTGSKCPSFYTTGPEKFEFCLSYDALDVSPKPADPSRDPETKLRKEVAKELNNCLETKCVSLLEEVRESAPDGFVPPAPATANVAQTLDIFDRFVKCEYACRVEAAKNLDIPLDVAANSLINELRMESKDLQTLAGIKYGYKLTVDVPRRYADFVDAVYNNTWTTSHQNRLKFVENFLSGSPAPGNPKFGGLESKLQCRRSEDGTICYGAILNNGSCGSCLVAGTKVLMADGSERVIEQVGPGDKVKTDEGEATVTRQVARVWPKLVIYSVNGGALEMTADHPVMTTKGWRAVDYDATRSESVEKYGLEDVPVLKVGDVLVTKDGTLEVKSLTAGAEQINFRTFNLRLKDGKAFYANGVLVKSN